MNEMPYLDSKRQKFVYGDYFPPEFSPFAYNETTAQELFPMTKAETKQQGYKWKESEQKEHKPTIAAADLPDHIKDVPDTITNEIIQCANAHHRHSEPQAKNPAEQRDPSSPSASQDDAWKELSSFHAQCTTAFKIIPQELEFYRKMNLPLPRLCPNCRHYQRIQQRNPLKLWQRQCQCAGAKSSNSVYKNTAKHAHGDKPCPNEFQTTYAPNRPEIVYCEKCYLGEVV